MVDKVFLLVTRVLLCSF